MATPSSKPYYGLILAGGRGTRFWPRSRKNRSKQVLNVFGERSLIQDTVDRLGPVVEPKRQWVLTNDLLRKEIVRQLPELPARQILSEPVQRNTAPAIGLAARLLSLADPDAVLGVFPSDHVVTKPAAFRKYVAAAYKAAARGQIVVLGIAPRHPDTGFGYIEFPAGVAQGTAPQPVKSFREKPDLKTAKRYVAKGNYFWNAGMFFAKASVILDALRRDLPDTWRMLDMIPAIGHKRFAITLAEAFPCMENISFDFAVMERARPGEVVGIPTGDFGWNDVGSWTAVHDLQAKDAAGNTLAPNLLYEASKGNYVDAGAGKFVALLGVDDLIVVDTPDALLVARRDQAQRVGDLVKLLEREGHGHLL